MSVAYFIVPEREVEDLDTGVDGGAVARSNTRRAPPGIHRPWSFPVGGRRVGTTGLT
jgi:hypothetical protein